VRGMTETPIACSLTAAGYRRRMADIQRVARAALVERQPIAGGARFSFADDDATRSELEALIAAESSCCPFLTMHLRATAGRLVLEITGPAEAAPILEEMFGVLPSSACGHG
jgi:MerR family transcriptional regulator, copper efflux regulator